MQVIEDSTTQLTDDVTTQIRDAATTNITEGTTTQIKTYTAARTTDHYNTVNYMILNSHRFTTFQADHGLL